VRCDLTPGHAGGTSDSRGGSRKTLGDDGNGLGYVCGWSIPDGCARRGVTPAKGRVTDFNIAGSDDAASGQQVQRGPFLLVVRSAER
jgi:hypothetical protein